jgi:hypothetical protein
MAPSSDKLRAKGLEIRGETLEAGKEKSDPPTTGAGRVQKSVIEDKNWHDRHGECGGAMERNMIRNTQIPPKPNEGGRAEHYFF